MKMKQTQTTLMLLFCGIIIAALGIVALFETDIIEPGATAGYTSKKAAAITYLAMLITLVTLPASLRLFKFAKIEQDLKVNHEFALQKWGVVRLSLLGIVLLANSSLYYVFMDPSLGWLAIITLLCMTFVYPSRQKCEYEAFMNTDNAA